MKNLIIVANRLPVSIGKGKDGHIYRPSVGGLATGLSSLRRSYHSLWMGWPGYDTSAAVEKQEIETRLAQEDMYPVFLSKKQIVNYYDGFSNKTIWPLFHYFKQYAIFEKELWEGYRQVNKIFCDQVLNLAGPDDMIWIHDYHLMLLPALIREKLPEVAIGFFLHIPFPSYEIYRSLPWRKELIHGLLGADLIGFHTFDYVRHFLSAATRLLGLDHTLFKLHLEDRIVKVDSFPMGIEYEKFAQAAQMPEVQKEITKACQKICKNRLVLSIDRLDYSKAIPQRLKAYELFLRENPDFHQKITLILVVVPSRSKVPHYQQLKEEVDLLVGRINGAFGTIGWSPIEYLYRALNFPTLSALYLIADVALVTPFRDGMNLIAKEYVASRSKGTGVLILSEEAGAAQELGDALLINPHDVDDIKNALKTALNMPEAEQIRRNQEMQKKLKRYDINRWGNDFVEALKQTREMQVRLLTQNLNSSILNRLVSEYRKSRHRLLFLDYDGTLVPFKKSPEKAIPPPELKLLLQKLANDPWTTVVLISGRNKDTLADWFDGLGLEMVAEHGVWISRKGQPWQMVEPLSSDWKKEICSILELFVERTPGAFIEEKDYSLVWHYRNVDLGLGERRARELAVTLKSLTENLNVHVLEGNKVIEVKNTGINKGRAAFEWLNRQSWDFILAIGDDLTDEDVFKALPDSAYSIKVGIDSTAAKYKIKSPEGVWNLLLELAGGNDS